MALRDARQAAGLTQNDAAKALHKHASFISKCESGERRLDVIELAQLCRLYKVRLIEFLRNCGLD
jgi:ribosome-binding protein aMBF1 (putative translation factor)